LYEPPDELASAVLEESALVSDELDESDELELPHAARLAHIAPASNIANNLFFMWKTSLLFVLDKQRDILSPLNILHHVSLVKNCSGGSPDSPLIR
jgi:hypothetical protein